MNPRHITDHPRTSRVRRHLATSLVGVGALMAIAAGCSDDDQAATAARPTTAPPATTGSTGSTAVDATTADGTAAGGVEVGLADDAELGPILVDADGMTLYMSEREADGTVSCVEDCTEFWPPAPVSEVPVVAPELTDRIGAVERPDGALQATFDGMPLYRFKFDAEPGDKLGNEVEDVFGETGFVWHAAVLTELPGSSVPSTLDGAVVVPPASDDDLSDDYDYDY